MPNSNDDMIKEPIFLVGSERSGTTLLRLMLDHHPSIAFHFEFEFAVEMIADDGTLPPVEAYRDWLVSNRIFRGSAANLYTSLDYRHLVNSVLEQKRRRDKKQLVGATVHTHFDRLLHVWPDARYIHLLRDGRDVARSCIQMGWAGNAWTGADRWIEAERLWATLRNRLPRSRYCEVTYEALVERPQDTLGSICVFLGVPFHESMLSYPDDSTYELPKATAGYQWKRTASEEEIRLAEARIGDLLVERGYALSGLPKLDLSPWQVRKLRLQDRWTRRLFRVRRYGLFLCVLEVISRKTRSSWLARYVAPQVEAIGRQYMK
jgi:hypothetical protein